MSSTVEYFFKRYYVRLCSFAYPWVESKDIAEDIVQDAFIVLVNYPDILLKEERQIKSFLYSTVKNLAMKHKRDSQIAKRINESLKVEEEDGQDLLASLIKAEIVGELHAELVKLPDSCQHICRLIYLEEMKYEEVAQELNLSINTIKSQRQRAIRLLKDRFLSIFHFFI